MSSAKQRDAKKASSGQAILNKKARHEYEIVDTLEVGLVLTGAEVKAIRAGNAQLKESYIKVKGNESFLVGCHISPYAFNADPKYDPIRERKLLMHKREIFKLQQQIMQKGLSVIPLKLYFNDGGRCKMEIGIGRGKKLHDKRQSVKEKEVQRSLQRYKI
jgi:SsrA-binding protein